MTDNKILNAVFRRTVTIIFIGAAITAPLSAAASESSFLSAEFHAAVTEAADRFHDELGIELAENIRPPTALRVSLVVASGAMEDDEQEDQLMSSHSASVSGGNDT